MYQYCATAHTSLTDLLRSIAPCLDKFQELAVRYLLERNVHFRNLPLDSDVICSVGFCSTTTNKPTPFSLITIAGSCIMFAVFILYIRNHVLRRFEILHFDCPGAILIVPAA